MRPFKLLHCSVALVLFTFVVACTSPEEAYEEALASNTVDKLRAVVEKYPDHPQAADATRTLGELEWKRVSTTPSVEALSALLGEFPNGKFTPQARTLLDDLSWTDATTANDTVTYEAYLAGFPEGRHSSEARVRIEGLAWDAATLSSTIEGLESFLEQFPGSSRRHDALQRIQLIQDAIVLSTLREGGLDEIQELVAGGYAIDDVERLGAAALHFAAQSCRPIVTEWLIAQGADVNQRASGGSVPLHWAVESNCTKSFQMLLDADADVSIAVAADSSVVTFGKKGETIHRTVSTTAMKGTALHWAAFFGRADMVSVLIAEKADVNVDNGYGILAIHKAAQSGHIEIVEQLLAAGSKLQTAPPGLSRAKDSNGASPIHYAKTVEMVKFFVDLGESPFANTWAAGTPIHKATDLRHNDVVAYLLESGADPNEAVAWSIGPITRPHVSPMWIAAAGGNLPGLQLLRSKGGDLDYAGEGGTLLHAASMYGDVETLEYLMRQGLELEKKVEVPNTFPFMADWQMMTPLCTAACYGHVAVVDALLGAGADQEAQCNGEWNPLVHAIVGRHKEVVVRLLENGATRGSSGEVSNWNTTEEIKAIVNEHFESSSE